MAFGRRIPAQSLDDFWPSLLCIFFLSLNLKGNQKTGSILSNRSGIFDGARTDYLEAYTGLSFQLAIVSATHRFPVENPFQLPPESPSLTDWL